MSDLKIKEPKYKRDPCYVGRKSLRHMSVSTTRNNGTIDIVATESRQYSSKRAKDFTQFHNYNRDDIEKLRDFLTTQLDDRKYW